MKIRKSLFEEIFVVIALMIFTGAFIPFIHEDSGNIVEASQGDIISQALLIFIYGLTFLIVYIKKLNIVSQLSKAKLFWVLISFALLSILWSDAPDVTLRRIIALLGTIYFGVYVSVRFKCDKQLELLAWMLGITAVLSFIFATLTPELGISKLHEGAWRGIYSHKNTLGKIMSLSSLVFMYYLVFCNRKRPLYIFLFLLSVFVLIMSDSKTALVVSILGIMLLFFFLFIRIKNRLIIPFTNLVLVLSFFSLYLLLQNDEIILHALGKDITLTGRTNLWNIVISLIVERPWLGYGYSGFWLGENGYSVYVWSATNWQPPHAHNGILDLCLDLGIIGTTIFLANFLLTYFRGLRMVRISYDYKFIWPLAYLSFMILYNFTESVILVQNSIFLVIYTTITLSLNTNMLRKSYYLDSKMNSLEGRKGNV